MGGLKAEEEVSGWAEQQDDGGVVGGGCEGEGLDEVELRRPPLATKRRSPLSPPGPHRHRDHLAGEGAATSKLHRRRSDPPRVESPASGRGRPGGGQRGSLSLLLVFIGITRHRRRTSQIYILYELEGRPQDKDQEQFTKQLLYCLFDDSKELLCDGLGFMLPVRGVGVVGEKASQTVELRTVLTRIGPTFVKIGQGRLSTPPDLCPTKYLEELSELQDSLPTFPDEEAFACIEKDLGVPLDSMYSAMSPSPIAAASLGQVYKARLKNSGQLIAIKVQRPDEFACRVFQELNYVQEGQNARRFKKLYADKQDILGKHNIISVGYGVENSSPFQI